MFLPRADHRTKVACLAVATLLVTATGCLPVTTPETDDSTAASALLDGHPDTVYANVVEMRRGDRLICTATLVGRRTLLTAAHCVVDDAWVGARVSVGDRVRQAAIVDAKSHPEYVRNSSYHDVALLFLDRDITGREPGTFSDRPPFVGEAVGMVGYGISEGDVVDHVRRAGMNTIAAVSETAVTTYGMDATHAMIAKGDSGGPLLSTHDADTVIAGVASQGTAPCATNLIDDTCYANFSRVDVDLAFIRDVANGDLYDGQHFDSTPMPELVPCKQTVISPATRVAADSFATFVVKTTCAQPGGYTVLLADGVQVQASASGSANALDFVAGWPVTAGRHTFDVQTRVEGTTVNAARFVIEGVAP